MKGCDIAKGQQGMRFPTAVAEPRTRFKVCPVQWYVIKSELYFGNLFLAGHQEQGTLAHVIINRNRICRQAPTYSATCPEKNGKSSM